MQIRKTGVALGATISTLGSLVSVANADSTSTSVSVPSNVASLTSGDKNFISSVKIDSVSSGTFVGKNIVVTTASNFLHMVDGKPQLIGDENTTHRVTTQTGTTYEFKNKDVHFLDKNKFGEGSQYDVAVVVIPGFERTNVGTELPTSATNPTNGQKVSAFGTGANGFEALVEKPISNLTQTPAGTLVSYQEGKPGMQGGGLFDADGNLIGMHLSTTTGASHDGLIFNQSQLDKIKEIANTNTPASTVTTTKAIVTVYEADPELEGGKQRIANEGVAEVVDGTGRVVTPGQPKVIKVGTKGSNTHSEIDFDTIYEDDPTIPVGEERVKTPGVKGSVDVDVVWTFDGATHTATSSKNTRKVAPINEVKLRGTKPAESTKPVETPKAETPKPVETPKAETHKPVETPKAETPKPAEPSKPIESTKPAEPTKPVESTKPSEPAEAAGDRHTEPIPFKTKKVEDENLNEGVHKVVQKGQEGLREFVKTTTKAPGSGKPELTKESTAVKNADGSYTQTIQVVSKPKKTTVEKPIDLLLIMDGSGSLLGRNTKNGPRVLDTAMRDALALVKSLPEGSQVSIMSYAENNSDSYRTQYYTKLLSKADAISMLNDLIKLTPQATYDWYRVWTPYANAHADKFLPVKEMQYEEAYQAQKNKLDNVSVIQFTDGWAYKTYNDGGYLTEDIDQSFAKWAKSNAKTFMSVVYPTIEDKEREKANNFAEPWSIMQMKKAGHPNAYNADGVPDGKREQDIINAFKNAAIETQPVSGSFRIDGTKGAVKLTNLKLVDPNGKDVPLRGDDKSNTYPLDIPGAYTLTYSFIPQNKGDIKGTFTIGDNTVTKTDAFVMPEGKVTAKETNRVVKEPVDEIIHIGIGGQVTESKKEPIPFATEIIEDEGMMEGEEKVTVEGMIGEKEILTTYKTNKGQKVGNPISTSEHVTKHMRTKIIHRGVKGSVTEKENVELPFETKLVEDDTLPLGEQKVVQVGVKGNKEITRTWTTHRKLKVGDATTSEKVTREPVEEIIHVGTREGVMDTEYEVIPYETKVVDDPTLEAGKEVVVVEGVNGQKAINKFYSISKGKVVSEVDTKTHVLRHPTDKVIHRGTGVKPETPKAETPKVETPKVEKPKVEEPKVETPKVEKPKVETPKVEKPKVETPKVETPKVEKPKVEEPKVEEPKPEAPKVETPKSLPKTGMGAEFGLVGLLMSAAGVIGLKKRRK